MVGQCWNIRIPQNENNAERDLTETNIEKLISGRDKLFNTTRNKSDNIIQNMRDEYYTNKNKIFMKRLICVTANCNKALQRDSL